MFRLFYHYFSASKTRLFVVETLAIGCLCLMGAWAMAALIASGKPLPPFPWRVHAVAALVLGFVVMLQFALYLLDLYNLRVAARDGSGGSRALKAGGLAAGVMGVLLLALRGEVLPQGAILGGALGAMVGSILVRRSLRSWVGHPRRVLVIGRGGAAEEMVKAIEREGEDAFLVCGVVDPLKVGATLRYRGSPALASRGRKAELLPLVDMAQTLGAQDVVRANAHDGSQEEAVDDALLECRLAGLSVHRGTDFVERALRRLPVDQLDPGWLAYSDGAEWASRRWTKRAVDLVLASGLALLALPMGLVVALAIRLDSPGSIFYRQERVGLGGQRYWLWKFRSMMVDAERDGAVWARSGDARVTRVGSILRKFRIDEIPQVINVLRGEMSFVGPRPERPVFVAQIQAQVPYYALRDRVKPGITGWAQIRYPYGASVEDAKNKLEYDLYYVKNGTLMLDLAILFHTVRHVLLGRGAR